VTADDREDRILLSEIQSLAACAVERRQGALRRLAATQTDRAGRRRDSEETQVPILTADEAKVACGSHSDRLEIAHTALLEQ